MMSPVDGRDPWGIVDNFCTQVADTLNFALPILVLSAGLDNVQGGDCVVYQLVWIMCKVVTVWFISWSG